MDMKTTRMNDIKRSAAKDAGRPVGQVLCMLCGAALIVLSAGACSHRDGDGERIAVFTKNQTDPYFGMLRLGAEDGAKQMHARVTQYVPTQPSSIPEQM